MIREKHAAARAVDLEEQRMAQKLKKKADEKRKRIREEIEIELKRI